MDDILINHSPKTDFEKLIWERDANKKLLKVISNLHIRIGQMQSEIDELKYLLNKKDNINFNSKKWQYEVLKKAHKKLQLRIRDLRKTNKELVYKLIHK